jgi:toxin ParE1/3/4
VSAKPVVPREAAHQDVESVLDHYLQEASPAVALKFIDQLEKAYVHLARHPGTGSPRYGHALNIPGLRSWPLMGFPYLVFYVDTEDCIDVWRVLHDRRNIPEWMRET